MPRNNQLNAHVLLSPLTCLEIFYPGNGKNHSHYLKMQMLLLNKIHELEIGKSTFF